MTTFRVLNPEGYPPQVGARGMAPSLDVLDGSKLFLVDVGFANSDNFMAQLHGWFEDHRPDDPDGDRPLARPARVRPRAVRAHPGRGRRGHHRRRHLTGLRAGGLRPRRRHGVEVRDPHGGSPSERLRPARAQHRASRSGMPSARQAFVPTPLMNTPPAVLRQYVEGDDPVHRRPFMAEVFDQLTRPVPRTSCAARTGTARRALRRGGERGGDARALP